MPSIDGKTVAFLATDGVEQVELDRPWQAVTEAGGRPELVSLQPGEIQAFNHLDKADRKRVDSTVDDAGPDDYDALALPGGVANGDFVRADERAVRFVRAFVDAGKPIAVICHGGWVLAEVVTDQGLISSRNPRDLDAFCAKMVEEIAAGVHV